MANKYLNLIDHTYKAEAKPKIMSKAIAQQYNTKYSFKEVYCACPDAEFVLQSGGPLNKWISDRSYVYSGKYQVVFIGSRHCYEGAFKETAV